MKINFGKALVGYNGKTLPKSTFSQNSFMTSLRNAVVEAGEKGLDSISVEQINSLYDEHAAAKEDLRCCDVMHFVIQSTTPSRETAFMWHKLAKKISDKDSEFTQEEVKLMKGILNKSVSGKAISEDTFEKGVITTIEYGECMSLIEEAEMSTPKEFSVTEN